MRTEPTPPLVVFDDARATLTPLTDLRPSWDIRTGAMTTRQRLESLLGTLVSACRPCADLAELTRESCPVFGDDAPATGRVVLVSGACALPPEGLTELAPGQTMIERASGRLIAANLDAAAAGAWLADQPDPAGLGTAVEVDEPCLLTHAWDVIRFRDRAIAWDLADLLRRDNRFIGEAIQGVTVIHGKPVAIDLSATVCPSVVLDSTSGPVVIDEGAIIRPGAVLVGPVYVGKHSVVLERTLIKANTAIGPVCKVAGEVGGTIFQGHANKAHDGHLGDSWVGEWANLGAGTTNSNLLNTYAEVIARATPESARERTGLVFLGAIIGDHVKTAIGTRIMTGSVLGTGLMIACTQPPPTTLGAFTWLTDAGGRAYRVDKFMDVARQVMSRRSVRPSEAYAELVRLRHQELARAGS